MSENWTIQDTIQGLDEHGLTRMINIRATDYGAYKGDLFKVQEIIGKWKPLPLKSYGGAGKPRKDIKPLPDAPECPAHHKPMNPRRWSPANEPDKVIYFWSCGEKTNGEYCKEKMTTHPTSDQYAAWLKLNEIEGDAPKTGASETKVGGTDWKARGNVIAACKKIAFWNGDFTAIIGALEFLEAEKKINGASPVEQVVETMNKYATYLADKKAAVK